VGGTIKVGVAAGTAVAAGAAGAAGAASSDEPQAAAITITESMAANGINFLNPNISTSFR
jgi:hypothetical protein